MPGVPKKESVSFPAINAVRKFNEPKEKPLHALRRFLRARGKDIAHWDESA